MSVTMMRVRELAAWGLDQHVYRPAACRGNPDSAHALLSKRARFETGSALMEFGDCRLQERFREQEARADLRAEMAGLDWSLGVVDLRRLLAFQRRIVFDSEGQESPMSATCNWDELMGLCFRQPRHLVCNAVRSDESVLLCSTNPNLHFRITNDCSIPIAVHSGSPFFEVAHYRDRWFLRDGYHRAFRCLRAGVLCLPAVIVRAKTFAQIGAVRSWFFPEEVLFSSIPPRVIDFLDDALVIEYHRPPLVKRLRITVEESYTVRGENL